MEAYLLAVLPVLFTSFPVISTVCPTDFPHQYQCSCYKVVSYPQTSRWNAKSQCESQYSHLVFINSEEEKEALALWYPYGQTFFWIGLNGIESEEKTWDDGSSATYTNFGDHPLTFNDVVDCYRIVPYGWVDVHPDSWLDDACSKSNSYICEFEDAGCSTQLSEGEQSGCPSGFSALFGCSCYHIRPTAWKTREEARAICESLSSHLVFIESAEETDFLIENYNANFQYWIGLNGLETETKTWDDGTEAIYTYFGSAEVGAFNDFSGCYRIVSGSDGLEKWYDWDCEGTWGYICEYNMCQTTTTVTTKRETTSKQDTTLETTVPPTTVQDTTRRTTEDFTTKATTKSESTEAFHTTLKTTESPTTAQVTTRQTPEDVTTAFTTKRKSTEAFQTTLETTETPTTAHESTRRTTETYFETTATTVQQSTEVSTETDVGIFFGFYTLGSSIRSANYLVQYLPDQSSIVSCASKCTEVNCGAFSFQYQTSSCRIAALLDASADRELLSVDRTFSCLHGDDFDICL